MYRVLTYARRSASRSRRAILVCGCVLAALVGSIAIARLLPGRKGPVYLFVHTHEEARELADRLLKFEDRTGRLPTSLNELPGRPLRFRWHYLGSRGRDIGVVAYSLPVGWEGGMIVFIDATGTAQYENYRESVKQLRGRIEELEGP